MREQQTQPEIALVIPVYNGGDAFRQCLESIVRSECPPDELIVAADGDGGTSKKLAEEFGAHVIDLPACGGPARARNVGAAEASGDILFFVDADVTLPSDAIRQVAEAFKSDHCLTAVIGSYDDEPAGPNFLSQYKNLLHHYVHQTGREEACTFWGACGAVRRHAFHAVGGFDENYRIPCMEDIEFGYRLKAAGEKIRLLKTLQVKHLKIWTAVSLLKTDFLYRAIPWSELILHTRRAPNDLNLNWSSRVSVIAIYGLLATLIGGVWWQWLLPVSGVLLLSLLVVNAPLYCFFWRKRGLRFAMKAIPWHWLYYAYGGLAFAISLGRHLLTGRRGTWPDTEPISDSRETRERIPEAESNEPVQSPRSQEKARW